MRETKSSDKKFDSSPAWGECVMGAGGGRLVIAGGTAQIYNLSGVWAGVGGPLIAPVSLNIAPEHFSSLRLPSLNVLQIES